MRSSDRTRARAPCVCALSPKHSLTARSSDDKAVAGIDRGTRGRRKRAGGAACGAGRLHMQRRRTCLGRRGVAASAARPTGSAHKRSSAPARPAGRNESRGDVASCPTVMVAPFRCVTASGGNVNNVTCWTPRGGSSRSSAPRRAPMPMVRNPCGRSPRRCVALLDSLPLAAGSFEYFSSIRFGRSIRASAPFISAREGPLRGAGLRLSLFRRRIGELPDHA